VKRILRFSTVLVFILSSIAFGQFKTGQQAPDFTLPDMDGNYVTLSELIGDGPIYINFWATWCGPCKKELPELIELYHEYKDRGFKVLAITTDGSRTAGKVKAFVKDRGMDFTILMDSNQEVFSRKYKGRGIPYGFLIDNDGKIIYSVRGYMPGLKNILTEKMTPELKPVSDKKAEGEGEKEKNTKNENKETEK
jgi:peroxiredoxin